MSEIIEDIKPGEATFYAPVCNSCKRKTGPWSCQAFEEIPDEIIVNGNKHTEPLPGQTNDFIYSPK